MTRTPQRVAVIGAGAWGQALALHVIAEGHRCVLWARRPDAVHDAERRSLRLPGIVLPRALSITDTLPSEVDLVLLAVPMQHLRAVLPRLDGASRLVLCCKGIEAGTGALPSELAEALAPGRAIAILSGPNFAAEVAAGLPAAGIVAAAHRSQAEAVIAIMGSRNLRLYPSDDPIGSQIGGAAKNVVAIAAGAAIGAGLGENARAALITRGLAEIARLAVACGGRADTIYGLSGAGDLILTCTGQASRNYTLGIELGRGGDLADILARRNSVAEGVATAPMLVERGKKAGCEMPIGTVVAAMVAGAIDVAEACERLLARPALRE